MKKIVFFLLIFIIVISSVYFYLNHNESIISPLGINRPKPLLVYTFANLKNTKFPSNQITLGQKVDETPDSLSQMFYFSVPKTPNSKVMIKASGVINLPKKPGTYPIIVMLRGFVPDEQYQSGIGTQPSAKVFAKNGFITLAPDFLGFGESASGSADPFENRFQSYTSVLSLLSSLDTLNTGLTASYSGTISADTSKVGMWGHSNGGHIALAVLEISGFSYPTVLWAPVSKSFPYSILYYTDEADDRGKSLRKFLANFEKDYDTEQFSTLNYYSWIKAPLAIFQGEADQEVPVWWSDDLVKTLGKNKIDVKYFTYPGADHNLQPSGWSDAVLKSMDFYQSHFAK